MRKPKLRPVFTTPPPITLTYSEGALASAEKPRAEKLAPSKSNTAADSAS